MQGTIYILNNQGDIINTIPKNRLKFIYNKKLLYTMELYSITFYGVKRLSDFTKVEYYDDYLIINNIIFKKIKINLDGYYISNTGAIYSTYSNSLRKQNIDRDGYHRISFSRPHMTNIAIHRLVYKTWVSEIKDGYVIDHIDNKKWNNNVNNLQSITAMENSRKAANDQLYLKSFYWNEEIVHKVCEMMQDNISVKDIAKKFAITPDQKRLYKNFRNQLWHLRNYDRAWKDISSQYDFSGYDGFMRSDSKFRDTEVLEMRKLYNNGVSADDIAKLFNTTNNNYFRKILKGKKRKIIKILNK